MSYTLEQVRSAAWSLLRVKPEETEVVRAASGGRTALYLKGQSLALATFLGPEGAEAYYRGWTLTPGLFPGWAC